VLLEWLLNLVHVRQENVRLQRQVEVLQGQLPAEAYMPRACATPRVSRLAFPQAVVAEVVGIDQFVVRSGYN
jgi:hypothetical protein